jgi:hypothetical protein
MTFPHWAPAATCGFRLLWLALGYSPDVLAGAVFPSPSSRPRAGRDPAGVVPR